MAAKLNSYQRIIEAIFKEYYRASIDRFVFKREDITRKAKALRVPVPKNIGDVIYTFRYRGNLPPSITATAPSGQHWIIVGVGAATYEFRLVNESLRVAPNPLMKTVKLPEATPGIIARYALSDEQALLAKLRYNRLLDVFTRLTCYSLQSHLRTNVKGLGQVETDEVYLGIDRNGAHYILPVQAKGGKDKLTIVQVAQDIALCKAKFPTLICRPIASQFLKQDVIVLFEFDNDDNNPLVVRECHYRLVHQNDLTEAEIESYRTMTLALES